MKKSKIIPVEEAKDVEVIEKSTITKLNDMDITISGSSVVANVDNALKILHTNFNGHIWYDEFYQKYFSTYNFNDPEAWDSTVKEWDNEDDIRLAVFMQREFSMSRISDEIAGKAMRVHAKNHIKNEPKDWMKNLIWDQKPRIETFLIDCVGAEDNDYTRAVSKNFWISMAARINNPGCQMRNMMILEGPQDSGKSKTLAAVGGKWYCDCLEDINSKDFFQVLQGRLIIEIGELSSFRRAEMTRVKQVVSCQVDRFRTPYDRHPKDNPRTCVFVGSTNDSNYFNDNTGATRFWPIKTNVINIDRVLNNRNQLFAEAMSLYKQGLTWWETPSSAIEEQEERRQVDPWEEVINSYIKDKPYVTSQELFKDCLFINPNQQTRADTMRIGSIFKLLKWEHKQRWIGNERKWFYIRPENVPLELPTQENINWEN